MAFVFPAAASAHSARATISCTGVDFSWFNFNAGANTVHFRVVIDGVVFQEGTQVIGTSGQLHVPLTLSGKHVVKAFSFWFASETVGGVSRPDTAIANIPLNCPPPSPPPPPTTTTTSTPTPPTTTTTTTTPSTPASGAAPVAVQPPPAPVGGVAGTEAASATARVSAQRRCATRTTRVTVSGRLIRRVTFFVNGRRVRTVTVRAGQTRVSVSLPVRRSGARRQTVTARVTFRNGAASRTLTAHATRCAAAAVKPKFTG